MRQLDHPPQVKAAKGDYLEEVTDIIREKGPQIVIAVLLVDEDGRVIDVIIRKADYTFFADRVRDAAKRFRFERASYQGKPTKWHIELPFEFNE